MPAIEYPQISDGHGGAKEMPEVRANYLVKDFGFSPDSIAAMGRTGLFQILVGLMHHIDCLYKRIEMLERNREA